MEISVCIIVKNEENVLRRILTCASKFADEIIVVDTGSVDATKSIAAEFTNNVFDFVWVDDFSAARNFSFSKATKQYIMWLDADDYIDEENIQKILKLKLIDENFDVIMCKYLIQFSNNPNDNFVYYRERIVKNNGRFVWQGFIHEAITPSGKIMHSNITIEHRKEKAGDKKRNLKIYRKHISHGEVLDARGAYYYAKELYYNGYYTAAIKGLNKFLKYPQKFAPNEEDAVLTKARCYYAKKRYSTAVNVLLSYAKNKPINAEMACVLGDCMVEQNIIQCAIFWYNCALNLKPNLTTGAFIDTKYYTIIPALQLCSLYYKLGEKDKSYYYHLKCKEFAPNHNAVKFNDKFFK